MRNLYTVTHPGSETTQGIRVVTPADGSVHLHKEKPSARISLTEDEVRIFTSNGYSVEPFMTFEIEEEEGN